MGKNKKSGIIVFLGLGVAMMSAVTACTMGKEDAPKSGQGEVTLACKGDTITVSSGNGAAVKDGTATISKPGTYRISGTMTDGQIIVDSEAKGEVRLILDGADLTCKNSSPIYIMQASATVIELAPGTENILTDSGDYEVNAEDEPDACIFSKDDLTIEGEGSLAVTGNYGGGIHGKDKVVMDADTVSVKAETDGITGKDGLSVKGGTILIESGEKGFVSSGMCELDNGTVSVDAQDDAVHSNDSIQINDGVYTLSSGDDGIHADNSLTIAGGTITVTESEEGLEAAQITITDGEISLVSNDDGINASNGSSDKAQAGDMFAVDEKCAININGGNLHVNAGGDGIDSNGNLYMTGGNVTVSGSASGGDGALDYNGEFIISGGMLAAAGKSDMAQSISGESAQCGMAMAFTEIQKEGAAISLQDDKGNEIISFITEKEMNHIVFSSPDLQENETYVICVDGEEIVSCTLSGISTWFNEDGETKEGGGMRFGGHGGMGKDMGEKDLSGRRWNDDRMKKGDAFPNGTPPSDMDGGKGPDGTPPSDMGGGKAPNGVPPSDMDGEGVPDDIPSRDMMPERSEDSSD